MSNTSIFWICACFTVVVACLMIYLLSLKLLGVPKLVLPAPNTSTELLGWISAFGGYVGALVALLAAVLTVSMLSRQISLASNQHLELMSFQAHGTLVQVRQVQIAAGNAHGTVLQLVDSTMNWDDELTDKKLSLFSRVAEETKQQIVDARLTEKVYNTQGLRSALGSFESALEEWILSIEIVSRAPEKDAESGETRRQMLRRLSGPLIILESELENIQSEASDFIKRWSHLMP